MKYIDLFAGIGGFRHALDTVGFECVFTSEKDEIPAEMYKLLHGESYVAGDITQIDAVDVPDHDLMVGGITCQGFSTNGLRNGFSHKTGNLFFEVVRIAEEKQPRYILIENVPGLLNHDKARTVSIMLNLLSSLGYAMDFTVLNSTDFGLPQLRKRVFIIAALGIQTEEWIDKGVNQVEVAKEKVLNNYPDIRTFNFPFPEGTQKASSLKGFIEEDVVSPYVTFNDDFLVHMGGDVYRIRDGTKKGYTEFEAVPFQTTIDFSFLQSKTRRGRVKQGLTKTLDQSVEVAVYDGNGFRKLTPLEVFRLQGFDESAHDLLVANGFSDTQLYARPSRSISIPIVKGIGEALKKFDKENFNAEASSQEFIK